MCSRVTNRVLLTVAVIVAGALGASGFVVASLGGDTSAGEPHAATASPAIHEALDT